MVIYGSIICLGDSLTQGSRDEMWRGYPIELELLLWRRWQQNWNCINAGVAGETSIDVYKRAYGVLRSYPEAAEMILLVGTNDAKDQVKTPPEAFIEHVEAIVRCAERWDKMAYLCTIPELKGFGAPDFCDPDLIVQYNSELAILALRRETKLIELRGLPASAYADGVHLNNNGYKMLAVRVAQAIQEKRQYGKKSQHGMPANIVFGHNF